MPELHFFFYIPLEILELNLPVLIDCSMDLVNGVVVNLKAKLALLIPNFIMKPPTILVWTIFFGLVTPFEEKYYCLYGKPSTSYMGTEKRWAAGKIASFFTLGK